MFLPIRDHVGDDNSTNQEVDRAPAKRLKHITQYNEIVGADSAEMAEESRLGHGSNYYKGSLAPLRRVECNTEVPMSNMGL